MHELVVGRAPGARQTHRRSHGPEGASKESRALRARQADERNKPRRQSFEVQRSSPYAVAAWMNVGEEAKNTVAVCGPRGESVHVRKIIARVKTGGPAAFLERAETRQVQAHVSAIRREQILQEMRGAAGIVTQHTAQHLHAGGIRFGQSANAVFRRPVGDVLVKGSVRLLETEQKFAFLRRKRKRSMGKIEDVAGLEFRAQMRGVRRRRRRGRSSDEAGKKGRGRRIERWEIGRASCRERV